MSKIRAIVCTLGLLAAGSSAPVHAQGPAGPVWVGPVRDRAAFDLIERHAFAALRPADQALIRSLGQAPAVTPTEPEIVDRSPASDDDFAVISAVLTRARFDALRPEHRRMLRTIVERRLDGRAVPMCCFAPDTAPEIVQAFERAVFAPLGLRFQNATRWSTTATNTTPTSQGDRVTLRYSFVPDGTSVPTLGATNGTSNLFAFFNGIYGNAATWQAIYAQVLARWGDLCGVTYVFEPNDDGLSGPTPIDAPNSSGVIGVRGDLRFSGTALDGPSNVLAFNFFPFDDAGGDMVIDTADTFYNTITNDSLRTRNVLSHEHGHGLGFAHVCPNNQTKLMEPFISTAYEGPQIDDILNSQRGYGDPSEPNDTAAAASSLPAPSSTPFVLANRSLDGVGDTDNYLVNVTGNAILSVTIQPPGSTYAENFQNGGGGSGCIALGSSYNPATARTLQLRFFQGNSTTLLASATASPGNPITLNHAVVPGTSLSLRIEVSAADAFDAIQPYSLTYSSGGPGSAVSLAESPPASLTSSPTPITVSAASTSAISSVVLAYRFTPSAGFDAASMTLVGPSLYRASIPGAPCLSSPEYYIIVNGAGTATLPSNAPITTFRAGAPRSLISVFADSFDADLGWTFGAPGDTASTGIWTRGMPIGTLAQPNAANSGAACAFTGNAATISDASGTNDVDAGFTSLISPRFSLFNLRDVRINYARWYSNRGGSGAGSNPFRIDISNNNGSTWTSLETVPAAGPGNQGGWISVAIPLPSAFALSDQVRVRFRADDTGPGALVEGALDDFSVTGSLTADFNTNATIDVNDIFAFLSAWFARLPSADFNRAGGADVNDIFGFLAVWFSRC